ncbi:MAG: ATP-binding cassette domain-containing protein, partial [Verrucomicrobiales bacterium]|nr:ATP-binding cassette domain-containing protein [Verrucomicrobiales bacterium]
SLVGLNQIMEMDVERDERGAGYLSVQEFKPEIRIENLRFGYDPDSAPVLDGINLSIQPGERVAILGKIGSGKSSLLRLLMKLEQPIDGGISVSGIDLRQFDPAEIRQHMGYLPQDPTLLYGTLRSNLKAGCPWIEDQALLEAIDAAGLAGFIRSLPRGIDHPVAEGGRSLSGGQRQSVAAARALVEKPELLVFDEPTSSMDTSSEKRFLSKLDEYLSADTGRTMIVATHRRTVLSIVDRVVVIENGKVIADGPKEKVVMSKKVTEPDFQRETIPTPKPSSASEIGMLS